MEERMATKPGSTRTRTATALEQQQHSLPFWHGEERGVSNVLSRGDLFNCANIRRGERENYKNRVIASLHGTVAHYTGEELRQDDYDVFIQLIHYARLYKIGEAVQFTAYGMITDLAWAKSGASYKRLSDCIGRLKQTTLQLTTSGLLNEVTQSFGGSLIRTFRWQEAGENLRKWEVTLEPEIYDLFKSAAYSRIEWRLRLSLPPMAKWLHSMLSTHRDLLDYSVAELHRLSGSGRAELRKFKHDLNKALQLLVEKGFLKEALIYKSRSTKLDLVRIVRAPRPPVLEAMSGPARLAL
jgi:hypothetical protein